ncbi:MAG: 1,4-dihydroxy-2-naphthoate polyprenyltransferase [Firmicutes bacterium]|nr:1,4-dihydroxy-2-naphthoate polyprenyltransferase [Bacillota bacterium]
MQSSPLSIAWKLLRPPTLTASIAPVLIGTGLALQGRPLRPLLFIAMLLASMLIQSAANMLNEYYDFKRGLDNAEMVGIAGAIVRDNVQPITVLRITQFTLLIAFLIGVYICAVTSWWVAVVGVLSTLFLYLYSGGPRPISYTPFGEVTAGLIMGPVIILISYFIQTESVTWGAVLASLPSALLIGAILMANNIRDIEHDIAGGRRTLAIVAGRSGAIRILATAFIVAYLWTIALVITHVLPTWALLVLLSSPLPFGVPRAFSKAKEAKDLQGAFKKTSATLIAYAFLLFIGLLIQIAVR